MNIFYCDILNGDDANDGLTATTPKLSISQCAALVTTAFDEIRLRASENYSTSLGNWQWTNGTISIIKSGDETSNVVAGDYIYKGNIAPPQIYQVSTSVYDSVEDETIITLYLVAGYYEGDTEEVDTFVIDSSYTETPLQDTVTAGLLDGDHQDIFNRNIPNIVGGYDSTYTNVIGYTFLYNLSMSATANLLYIDTYWNIKNMVLLGNGYILRGGWTQGAQNCSFISKSQHVTYTGGRQYYVNNYYYGQASNKWGIRFDGNTIVSGCTVVAYSGIASYTYYYDLITDNIVSNNRSTCFSHSNTTVQAVNVIKNNRFISEWAIFNIYGSHIIKDNYIECSILTYYGVAKSFMAGLFKNNEIIITSYLPTANFTQYIGNDITYPSNKYISWGTTTYINEDFSSYDITKDPADLIWQFKAGDFTYNNADYYDDVAEGCLELRGLVKYNDKTVLYMPMGTLEVDKTEQYTGDTCLKIRYDQMYDIVGDVPLLVKIADYPFITGTTYNTSFKYKASGSETEKLYWNIKIRDNWLFENWEELSVSTSYQDASKTGFTVDKNDTGQIYIKQTYSSDTYIDKIEIT